MREEPHNYLELSLLYIKAGLYEEALDILEACPKPNPMCLYYQGYVHGLRASEMEKQCMDASLMDRNALRSNGAVETPPPFGRRQDAPSLKTLRVDGAVENEQEQALTCLRQAEEMNPDGCFPDRVEEIGILEYASHLGGAMAHYYLGNLFYDKKQYTDAVRHWEITAQQKPEFAMAHRNLAIAYYNHGAPQLEQQGPCITRALEEMARACELDPDYPRMRLEYDQLAARVNLPVCERLATLGSCMDLVKKRDDLYLRYITLLNCEERHQEALDAILSRQFHPWEGGEGKVSAQYRYARIHLAIRLLEEGKPEQALEHLEASLTYPVSLGEGKLPNVPDNQAYYYMGLAYRMIERRDTVPSGSMIDDSERFDSQKSEAEYEEEKSVYYLGLAAAGPQEPEPVLYYNDQPSDYIFYQGLANRALGREAAAKKAFHRLIAYGEAHLFDEVEYDFFAVSLPEIEVFQEDIGKRNRLYCNYLRALGNIGLGEMEKAKELLDAILDEQADYQGAIQASVFLNDFQSFAAG